MTSARERLHLETNRDENASVTSIELFFDLVFVFALTQVTAALADDLSWRGVIRAVLIMGLLWWSWVGYAWLFNVLRADEGAVRVVLFAAMGTMFVLSLSIPEAFDDFTGGLSGPVVVALCYFFFRALHLTIFWILADEDPGLRRQLVRFTPSVLGATALLLGASLVEGRAQTLLWALALLVDYGGTYLGGATGWRLRSVRHFAERHGLIVIVAIGESIVAVGAGAVDLPISWPIIAASLLGLTVAGALWWAYFDVTSLQAEHALARQPADDRARMARDAYSFLHFPLITGIVLIALGLKKVLEYVGDSEHHELSDPLTGIGLYALYGGVVMYLVGQVAFKARTVGTVNPIRLGAAVVLLALIPVAAQVPALAGLAILAAVVVVLVAIETLRFSQLRDEVRHGTH
jgi:low temperature requirement protein LtrA